MSSESSRPATDQQPLGSALQTLSAREQVGMLLRATRSLPNRDKAEVFRSAGLSLLRDRFLPLLLHIVLKRVLAGAVWWVLCIIGALFVLLLLAFVERINAHAVAPVGVALGAFFAGFLLCGLVDFCSDIFQFFKTTRPRAERDALLSRLNTYNEAEKVAVLRAMSKSLARKVPGESLLVSFLTMLLLLLIGALLIGLVILLSAFLPTLGSFPPLLVLAGCAFLLGFFVPREIHRRSRRST